MKKDTDIYNDIIELPHHVSAKHPHMPVADRAAQFAPFAALTGYDSAIKETARLTDKKLELDESEKALLDEKLRYLQEKSNESTEAVFTYFVPDKMKSGGTYVSESGRLKKVDTYRQTVKLHSGTVFHLDNLYQIDCEAFDSDFSRALQ